MFKISSIVLILFIEISIGGIYEEKVEFFVFNSDSKFPFLWSSNESLIEKGCDKSGNL
jgi:hypothetical protein